MWWQHWWSTLLIFSQELAFCITLLAFLIILHRLWNLIQYMICTFMGRKYFILPLTNSSSSVAGDVPIALKDFFPFLPIQKHHASSQYELPKSFLPPHKCHPSAYSCMVKHCISLVKNKKRHFCRYMGLYFSCCSDDQQDGEPVACQMWRTPSLFSPTNRGGRVEE